ncbi:MAG: hypothetical protein R2939_01965 [Kofleriaceae bacterium]
MRRARSLVLAVALGCGTAAAARADGNLGLELRADQSTHPLRISGTARTGGLAGTLVVDPMVVFDGQHDLDLRGAWTRCPDGWGPVLGWRTTAIGIADGHQLQHKLLVGLTAALPRPTRRLAAQLTVELATVIVKHGAGLPSEWISFASGRDYVDLLNFGVAITVAYDGGR